MRILVVGASGVLGHALLRHLVVAEVKRSAVGLVLRTPAGTYEIVDGPVAASVQGSGA